MNEPCYYRVSIKALPIDETGRFLLSKENNGKWELLGGGLDHGEDPIEGLKREVGEETGLVVTHVSPTPKYFVTSQRLGKDTYMANVIYEVKLKDLNFTPSDECTELRYFTVKEAAGVDLFPNVEEFIKHFDVNLHLN